MSFHYVPRPQADNVSNFDFNHLNSLKKGVRTGAVSPESKHQEVAHQFEALMIQQLMKQARQSPLESGPFDSQQTRLAQSMADEQMALQLSSPGLGLAQKILDQIQANLGGSSAKLGRADTPPELAASRLPGLRSRIGEDTKRTDAPSISALIDMLTRKPVAEKIYSAIKGAPEHIHSFVSKMTEAARVAASESGVPAKLILSQAALESGWGNREIMNADGTSSHNLFGIKASPNWKGKVVNIMTTEYEDGVPRKMLQPFRAYDSYAESFADYARLISNNDRYSQVVAAPNAEEGARRIQAAGYATDPAYADKLISIMSYFDTGSIK